VGETREASVVLGCNRRRDGAVDAGWWRGLEHAQGSHATKLLLLLHPRATPDCGLGLTTALIRRQCAWASRRLLGRRADWRLGLCRCPLLASGAGHRRRWLRRHLLRRWRGRWLQRLTDVVATEHAALPVASISLLKLHVEGIVRFDHGRVVLLPPRCLVQIPVYEGGKTRRRRVMRGER
jgi:hypothetical protein